MSTRYFRVFWTDQSGTPRMSDPLPTLTVAHAYAQSVGGSVECY